MSRQVAGTMTILRPGKVWNEGIENDVEVEREVSIVGILSSAERDVGIMNDYVSDIVATDEFGEEVELTEEELDRACTKLEEENT